MKESKFAIGTKIFRWEVTSDRYHIGTTLYVNVNVVQKSLWHFHL